MNIAGKVNSVNQGLALCGQASKNKRIADYLSSRGIDPLTADLAGVREWSAEAELWLREYFGDVVGCEDLVTPLVDFSGELSGVRVWPVPREDGRDLTKRAMRGQGESRGLVMACGLALAWLQGGGAPECLVIAEGEPDYLTCVQVWGGVDGVGVVGIISGSWTAEMGVRVPAGCRVVIRTDDDPLRGMSEKYPRGEQYARGIFATLPLGVLAWRYADPKGQHRDQNDLLKEGDLVEGADLLYGCAPYQPEPDPIAPPAPAPEAGSERGRGEAGGGDGSGWIVARAALAWVGTWEKCLALAVHPGGTHGRGGWAGLAWTCFRAAHGLQGRRHRVSAAQMDGVAGAAVAFARLDPGAMEAELEKAAEVGAQADDDTKKNRKEKVGNCAKDGAKSPLDMDGLTRYMDTRPPELKPKKEKKTKKEQDKKQKGVNAPALRDPVAQDLGEDEDDAAEDRRGFPPLPQVHDERWKDQLTINRDGETKGSLRNIDLVLSNDPCCKGSLKLNDFMGRVEIYGSPEWATETESGNSGALVPDGTPIEDDHVTGLCLWVAREYGADVEKGKMIDIMRVAGRRNKYDPLTTYLEGLAWDGVRRLDGWLEKYFAVKMEREVAAFAGRKWLISAVARALDPGCQADYSLVIEGDQGSGKSQALFALCPNPEWHLVFDFDPGSKEALEAMRGKWLVELAELAILSRGRDARIIKGFLTKMSDRYRASYGLLSKDYRRRSLFFGTVNPEGAGDYLTDPTGNRRWWPVRCAGRVDVAGLRRDRDQLWAEAVARYRAGDAYWPTDEEGVQLEAVRELRTSKDPWTYRLVGWLSETPLDDIPISEVLSGALQLEVSRQTKADQMRAAVVLRAAGWTAKIKGKWRATVWCKPEVGGGAAAPTPRKPIEDDPDPWPF